jgi:hypothetical protein
VAGGRGKGEGGGGGREGWKWKVMWRCMYRGKEKVGIGEPGGIHKPFFDGLESTTELAVDSRVISKPGVDSSGIHRRQSCAGRL